MFDPYRDPANPVVRSSVKALVIRDDALLVTVNHDDVDGDFYLAPGGGQDFGEDKITALKRECLEELGCGVLVGDVALLRDYVGRDHEFARADEFFHQSETYFWCDLDGEPRVTSTGDEFQTGFRWVPLADLADAPVWPKALAGWLHTPPDRRPRYLGNVN